MTSIAHDTTAGVSLERVLAEGYGTGAWHGPDLKAALSDVTAATAFRRPAPGRHNIAEIALHHAYCARAVRGQLTGAPLEPFALAGEDWFPVDGRRSSPGIASSKRPRPNSIGLAKPSPGSKLAA